jgi:tetratricopeptide (TPR) repeat protein
MYRHAIELDPNFSLAYTGLADCYNLTASGLAAQARFPLARAAATRAIDLDPRSGAAHTARAFMLYKFEWKWQESEQEFRRAIGFDPSYALAHHWFGEALKLQMRHDESIAEFKRAMELDPFSIAVRYDYILALLNAGRVPEARALLDDSVKLDPTNGRLMLVSYVVLRAEGRMPEAIEMRLQAALVGGAPEADVTALRRAFNDGGLPAFQRLSIVHTMRHAATGVDPAATAGLASSLAQGYADLHDREQTMKYLLESADKDEDAPLLMKTPLFDFVRDDPRFKALEARVFAQ